MNRKQTSSASYIVTQPFWDFCAARVVVDVDLTGAVFVGVECKLVSMSVAGVGRACVAAADEVRRE